MLQLSALIFSTFCARIKHFVVEELTSFIITASFLALLLYLADDLNISNSQSFYFIVGFLAIFWLLQKGIASLAEWSTFLQQLPLSKTQSYIWRVLAIFKRKRKATKNFLSNKAIQSAFQFRLASFLNFVPKFVLLFFVIGILTLSFLSPNQQSPEIFLLLSTVLSLFLSERFIKHIFLERKNLWFETQAGLTSHVFFLSYLKIAAILTLLYFLCSYVLITKLPVLQLFSVSIAMFLCLCFALPFTYLFDVNRPLVANLSMVIINLLVFTLVAMHIAFVPLVLIALIYFQQHAASFISKAGTVQRV